MKKDDFLKRVMISITTHLDYSEDSMADLKKAANAALDLADAHADEIPDEAVAAVLDTLKHEHS